MNVRLLQTTVGLVFAGLIGISGCTSDDDDTDDMTGTDAGPKDMGTVADTGVDTGVPADSGVDTGVDTGVDPCPDGEEGCECDATENPMAMNPFVQDTCDPGLLCVPWDVVTGDTPAVTGPVHSCVMPCAIDADCGADRFCVETSLGPESGARRMCVDELSDVDEFCHLSRGTMSRLPMVSVQLPGTLAGCADGRLCSPGGITSPTGDFNVGFGDFHPDNGLCTTVCRDQADCAGITGFEYCNPSLTFVTSTLTAGICSVQQLDQIGAICGAIEPGNPGSLGLSNGCDAAANLDCVGVDGLFPTGTGFCAQFCSDAEACTATEPGGEPYVCAAAPGNNPTGDGLCTFPDLTVFPDNCNGDGTRDLGRQDLTLVYGNGTPTTDDDVPLPLCVDRLGPPLDFTILTPDATGIALDGGDCANPADPFSWAKCLEGSFCNELQPGLTRCTVGCTRTTTTAAGPQGGCQIVSATSTCAPAYVDQMGNAVDIGLCGDM